MQQILKHSRLMQVTKDPDASMNRLQFMWLWIWVVDIFL